MSTADPLAGLRDIQLPAPVSAWPPALGWWLLAALVFVAVLVAIIGGWRRWRRRRYRRAALRALRSSYMAYLASGDAGRYLRESTLILKQAALAAFPRDRVAPVHGADWPSFLVATGGDPALQGASGRLLGEVYRASVEVEPDQLNRLQQLLEHWLRRHTC